MSHNTEDRLVYMANQIGKFFQSQGHDKEVAGVADHIHKFWDPRMRKAIFAHLDAGGAGLDPNVRDAIASLRAKVSAQTASAQAQSSQARRASCLTSYASNCAMNDPAWSRGLNLARPAMVGRSRAA
jgi:formate dehydrogenase subunit delta